MNIWCSLLDINDSEQVELEYASDSSFMINLLLVKFQDGENFPPIPAGPYDDVNDSHSHYHDAYESTSLVFMVGNIENDTVEPETQRIITMHGAHDPGEEPNEISHVAKSYLSIIALHVS